jgi:hypothetical protein
MLLTDTFAVTNARGGHVASQFVAFVIVDDRVQQVPVGLDDDRVERLPEVQHGETGAGSPSPVRDAPVERGAGVAGAAMALPAAGHRGDRASGNDSG